MVNVSLHCCSRCISQQYNASFLYVLAFLILFEQRDVDGLPLVTHHGPLILEFDIEEPSN